LGGNAHQGNYLFRYEIPIGDRFRTVESRHGFITEITHAEVQDLALACRKSIMRRSWLNRNVSIVPCVVLSIVGLAVLTGCRPKSSGINTKSFSVVDYLDVAAISDNGSYPYVELVDLEQPLLARETGSRSRGTACAGGETQCEGTLRAMHDEPPQEAYINVEDRSIYVAALNPGITNCAYCYESIIVSDGKQPTWLPADEVKTLIGTIDSPLEALLAVGRFGSVRVVGANFEVLVSDSSQCSPTNTKLSVFSVTHEGVVKLMRTEGTDAEPDNPESCA
jgi:hypothetical protein